MQSENTTAVTFEYKNQWWQFCRKCPFVQQNELIDYAHGVLDFQYKLWCQCLWYLISITQHRIHLLMSRVTIVFPVRGILMQAEGMHMNMKTLEVLLNVSEQLIDGQLCKQMLVVQLDVWSIRAEYLSLRLWYFYRREYLLLFILFANMEASMPIVSYFTLTPS